MEEVEDSPILPFSSEVQEQEVQGSEVAGKGYSRRRINNDQSDPNSWYKHRRKRNKKIKSGKSVSEATLVSCAVTSVAVSLDQFPYLQNLDGNISASSLSSSSISIEDVKYVVNHLGYIPYNLMTVAYYHPEIVDTASTEPFNSTEISENAENAQTRELRPAVLQLYPLNPYSNNNYLNRYDKEHRPFQHKKGETLFPFPTLFWMLSPSINSAVATLEEDGWITRLTERLRSEPAFVAQMESAHRAYAAERWKYLSPEHKQYVEDKRW